MGTALALGGRPFARLTLWETGDVEGDGAVAALLAEALKQQPGQQAVLLTVRTLAGGQRRLVYRAEVTEGLRRRLAEIAAFRAKRPAVRAWALRNALARHLRGWEDGRLVRWGRELTERWQRADLAPERWLVGWRRYEAELRRAAEAWPLWRAYLWACLEWDAAEDRPPAACWLCALAAGETSLEHRQAMAWWHRWRPVARNCPLHEAGLEERPWS